MARRANRTNQAVAERIASECFIARTRLLSRTLTRIYDDALRPLGITAAQLNLLVVVAKRGPIGQNALSKFLSMEKSTLSRNVERMRGQGWIATSPSGVGRGLLQSLTPKGHKRLEKSVPLWETAQAETEELLGKSDARSLRRITNTLWAAVAQG